MESKLMGPNKKHSIAVILATYNGERYLNELLDSIENQDVLPDELIIGDDGSTDKTLQIIANFKKRSRIPITVEVNKTRLGYGENFLRTASLAKSDLIAFADQDDIWLPSKLSTCLQSFDDPNVAMCAHTAILIDEYGKEIGLFSQGIHKDCVYQPGELEPWGIFAGFSIVIRRSILQSISRHIRGLDSHSVNVKCAHDRWAYFLADAYGKTITISKPLVKYRQHSENLFGSGQKGTFAAIRDTLQNINNVIARSKIYIAIAEHRARLLEEAAAQATDRKTAAILLNASSRWSAIARNEKARCEIYMEKSNAKKILRLCRNIVSGTYKTKRSISTKLRSCFKDFIYCFI
ncbi:glycosyltransferase [Methylocaldum szegediense]|uniref:glycosyltransferase n=1 Tax=Methylocaldum szegediense TaxID=73780 RepID=UPI00138B05A0|nr:glycosyltransferase [Methylocaldum szegediense]